MPGNTDSEGSEIEEVAVKADDSETLTKKAPKGVNQKLWDMLRSIKSDIKDSKKVSDERFEKVEGRVEKTETDITSLKKSMEEVKTCNQTLAGRLIRAEKTIQRQGTEITDMKMRSMRDNIVIRTKGAKYKEKGRESSSAIFRSFMSEELRVPDSGRMYITRAHRMGKANGTANRALIAKLPNQEDHMKIFGNAKALQGTDFSISKQLPPELDERRQFAWQDFKKAKAERKKATFDGGRLIIEGQIVDKYEPEPLPTHSSTITGDDVEEIAWQRSSAITEGTNVFQAWAVATTSVQQVREALDALLRIPEFADADNIPYGYRMGEAELSTENFSSDGDNSVGLAIIRTMRELNVNDRCIFVAHYHKNSYISIKRKQEIIKDAITDLMK